MGIALQVFLLALGFLMLVKGADWFVEGAAGIACKFGIPSLVIGLTIVAMGTSAPEAAVSIAAALKGSADITIGNIVGSNVLNILIILGISSVVAALAVAKSTIKYEMPFVIIISIVLFAMGLDGEISFIDGIILWAIFILYLVYLFRMAKNSSNKDEGPLRNYPMWKNILFTVLGLVLVVWGSSVTVDAASALARVFGLSERFIGLTIVAFGTSLPELFTSVTAAKRGEVDIAIGNIVGSNIFNILFVVGTSALIVPVPFAPNFRADVLISIAAAAVLLIFSARKGKLGKKAGITMLIMYAAYFVFLCKRP